MCRSLWAPRVQQWGVLYGTGAPRSREATSPPSVLKTRGSGSDRGPSKDRALSPLAWGPPGTGLASLHPRPATLAGRILIEALALAHGVEARAQLGQSANPLLSFLGGGRHQVQVLAAALEGDGEAARRREGAPEAPQALGLVALADGLDVLHED